MLWIMLYLVVVLPVVLWTIDQKIRKPKKVTSILGPSPVVRTPMDDLEEWWQANESKDAKIRRLEQVIREQSVEIVNLTKKQEPVLRGGDAYFPVPTVNNPSKVMVLPKPAYYTLTDNPSVGLKVEGHLAQAIMDPEAHTTLEIRGGRIVNWSIEGNWKEEW